MEHIDIATADLPLSANAREAQNSWACVTHQGRLHVFVQSRYSTTTNRLVTRNTCSSSLDFLSSSRVIAWFLSISRRTGPFHALLTRCCNHICCSFRVSYSSPNKAHSFKIGIYLYDPSMEFATHRCSSAGLATLIELDRTLRTISILTLTHGCCSAGASGAHRLLLVRSDNATARSAASASMEVCGLL